MRLLTLLFLVLATSFTHVRAELAPEAVKRAKMRIESLLGNRRGAAPTPVNPANPFVLPQSAPAPQEGQPPINEAPVTKTDVLTRLAKALNVSGYMGIKGVPHLIINRQPYRQNDLIPVRDGSGSVSFLLLKSITESDFTLELDGVELQQKIEEKKTGARQ